MQNHECPNHICVEETLLFGLKQKISSIGFTNISFDEMKNQIRIYKDKQLSRLSLLYIARCLIMFGNKYDYSKVEYMNSKTKVIIICPEHGEFLQTPDKHYNGRGCPKCGRDQLKRTMIDKHAINFIERCYKKHGINRYDYSETIYDGADRKILIKCNVCNNKFYQLAGQHLFGKGCPFCSESHMEKKLRTKLESFGYHQNIDFYREYTFHNLLGVTGSPLRYDFFIPSYNLLIELDGPQHYRFNANFQNTKDYNRMLKYDKLKTEYAEKNGFKLLRVRYDEFDKWLGSLTSVQIFNSSF